MFTSAKLKLTLLYLSILLTITGIFSITLYRFVSLEIVRGFERVEERVIQGSGMPRSMAHDLVMDNVTQAQKSMAVRLLYINLFIAGVAGAASYFLASRTLRPIEESVEEQKRFVADASHELRTPLTALKTNIEVSLRDKKLSTKNARETLQGSLVDVAEIEKLTNSLLDLSSIQDLKQNLPCEMTDLSQVVKKVVEKMKPLADRKKIKLIAKSHKSVVSCSPDGLSKLVEILVDNAIKYTPKGGKVTVSLNANKKDVVLVVKDNGIGIDKKDLPYIFDRFYRADDSRGKSQANGHGLGLSIAKKIVDLHDGTISVESKPGKGSTFSVKLPKNT